MQISLFPLSKSLPIIGQLIVLIVSFYYTDVHLLIYYLETQKSFIINYLLIMSLVIFQILLFRSFYLSITVDSVVTDKTIKSIKNYEVKTCKKCGNKKPKRAHHCRYCHKCIELMDHHCFVLGHCIGKRNYKFFISYIFLVLIDSFLVLWVDAHVLVFNIDKIEGVNFTIYGVLCVVAFFSTVFSIIYLLFLSYLNHNDLTTIEFIHPRLQIKDYDDNSEEEENNNGNDLLRRIIRLIYP